LFDLAHDIGRLLGGIGDVIGEFRQRLGQTGAARQQLDRCLVHLQPLLNSQEFSIAFALESIGESIDFRQSTYEAAAILGQWNRAELERSPPG
jgi:hypothetical protein